MSKGFKDTWWRTFPGGRRHLRPQPGTHIQEAAAVRPLSQRQGWDGQRKSKLFVQETPSFGKTPRGLFSKEMEWTAWGEPWQWMWVLEPSSSGTLAMQHKVWLAACSSSSGTPADKPWTSAFVPSSFLHLDGQPRNTRPTAQNRAIWKQINKKEQLKKTTHRDAPQNKRKVKLKAEPKQKTKNY